MTEPPDPHGVPDEPTDPAGPPDVGSLGEEAAKLVGALSDWARDSADAPGSGWGAAAAGLADHAAASLRDVNDHLATGAPECTMCPVCRTVHVVRAASPEVRAHLATAASSFLQAVAGALATVPPAGATGAGRSGKVASEFERIDLDGDDDE